MMLVKIFCKVHHILIANLKFFKVACSIHCTYKIDNGLYTIWGHPTKQGSYATEYCIEILVNDFNLNL